MKVVNKSDLLKSYMRTGSVGKPGIKSGVEGVKSNGSKGGPTGDIVEISSTAKEVSRLKEIAKTMPEERAERIEQVKQMVQNGTYKIEPEKIAERMIQHAIDLLA